MKGHQASSLIMLMEKKSTLEDLRRAIPWRLFAAAFVLIAVLACVFPVVPCGDGPFQTLNWISRIKQGQIPGRDFDVFHGIGVLWFHSMLALPFGAAREIIWIHYLGSLVAQWALWCSVFYVAGHPWRRALLEGSALCGLMLLSMGIPFANIAQLVGAGHSMIGARVALPLLCLFLAHRSIRSSGAGIWWRAGLIMGAAAGGGAWFATDQAPACLVMGMVTATGFAGAIRTDSMFTRFLRIATTLATVLIIAASTYVLLLWMSTGGALERCLGYWWQTLPQVQFWYFGGAPNAYFHQFRDLLDPSVLVLAFVACSFHLVGLIFRKSGQWPLRLGLAAYGMVSLLPLAGMFYSHYVSGLWCTGLIGVLLARSPDRLSDRVLSLISLRTTQIGLVVTCLVLTARSVQIQWKVKTAYPYANHLDVSLSGAKGANEVGGAVPVFVTAELQSRPSSNLVRAFYRAVPEISLGQAGVGRFDYIIHALGDEQQAEYRQVLQSAPPVFMRVPSQRDFRYAQWLWHQWPELWGWIFSNYQLEDIYQGSAYWRHADRATEPKVKPFAVQLVHENEVTVLRSEHRPTPGCLLRLSVTYRTERISGPLASAVDKMTRVTLRPSGVLDDQPFSWPPGSQVQVRQVYLLPKPGADVEVRLSGEGPILSSRLVVVGAVAEEIQGVDIEGLVKTFQP